MRIHKFWLGVLSFCLICPAQSITLTDQEAGEQFYRMVQQQVPLVSDALVTDYISHLGDHLVAYSNDPDDPFHFFVVDLPIVNAFAGPGGYIGVFGGLIVVRKNRNAVGLS